MGLLSGSQSHCYSVWQYSHFYWPSWISSFLAIPHAAGVSRNRRFYRSEFLLPGRHNARHDHGDLFAYSLIPGWLWELPNSSYVWRPRHGVPIYEHAVGMGIFGICNYFNGQFLCDWRTNRWGLDTLPPSNNLGWYTRP